MIEDDAHSIDIAGFPHRSLRIFGENVRDLRQGRPITMTQGALGKKIGVSQQTISAIEMGEYESLSWLQMCMLALALGRTDGPVPMLYPGMVDPAPGHDQKGIYNAVKDIQFLLQPSVTRMVLADLTAGGPFTEEFVQRVAERVAEELKR